MIINTILLLLQPMENVQFQILKKKIKKCITIFFLFVDLYHPLISSYNFHFLPTPLFATIHV